MSPDECAWELGQGLQRAPASGRPPPVDESGDPQRRLVRLRAKVTTIRAINRRRMPHLTPTSRDNAFERRVWRIPSQIVEYTSSRPSGSTTRAWPGNGFGC
jgi:hypothetical protein